MHSLVGERERRKYKKTVGNKGEINRNDKWERKNREYKRQKMTQDKKRKKVKKEEDKRRRYCRV